MKQVRSLFHSRCWLPGILLGLLGSLLFTQGLWQTARAQAASFTWQVIADNVPAPLFNHADGDVGIVKIGSNLWVEIPQWQVKKGRPEWHRYKGATLDTLVQQGVSILDSSFNRPNGDDNYWSSGVWQDANGVWYTPVHVEYDYASSPGDYPHWKRRIGLATSTDRGAHWHYQGDILTPDPNKPKPNPNYYDFGDGDQRLFVDSAAGYFYLYYETGWVNPKDSQLHDSYMAVARSPISSLMAPGSWTKWYNGSWSQPGLQGLDSEVLAGATTALSVQYNTYLGQYVLIDDGSITTATDLSTQNWATPDTTFPSTLEWYNWPFDPNTQNKYQIGQTFRLYSSQNDNYNVNSKYMQVTFSRNDVLSYTASGGFSPTQGQNQWRYQYTTDEKSYTDMTWDRTNNYWTGPEPYCVVAVDYQHPGDSTCASSRSWVAPSAGKVTVAASGHNIVVDNGPGAAGVNVMIKLNGTQLWPTRGWQYIPPGGSQVVPTLTANVSTGDTLHFIVAHTGNTNHFDSTAWDPIITYSVYNATSEFSSIQGQNQWRYQYTADEATYNDMSWDGTKSDWSGPEPYCLVDSVREHPGVSICVASRTWIAPGNGSITVTASGGAITVDNGPGATGVNVMIKLNGAQLWPTMGWQYIPPGGSQKVPSLKIAVSAGDVLHFLVAHTGNSNNFDSTYWDPIVTFKQA